jgi:hypothetical protein
VTTSLTATFVTAETLGAHAQVDNIPREQETYCAIARLCTEVLEPVVREFESVELTYGFASPTLIRHLNGRIAPALDQHAGHERRPSGALICSRLGQAVDLKCPGVPAPMLARFIAENTPFDRLYLYGSDRPLHVSCGPQESRAIFRMRPVASRLIPFSIKSGELKHLNQS